MGYKNREIERKFVAVKKAKLKDVSKAIQKAIGKYDSIIREESPDYYWTVPKKVHADFIRLRFMPDGTGQLTAKWADRGSNTDRVEIDVDVHEPNQCARYLNQIHGKCAGSVHKEYHVFFLDKLDTTVSVYQVTGDRRVFIEIEARNIRRVNQLVKLVGTVVEMKPEPRSLFQIFIECKE